MFSFAPQPTRERIPVAEFPYPVGSAVRGSLGSLYTVIDRQGDAFLACCAHCDTAGKASGWYPVRANDRILHRLEAAAPQWQTACRTCVRGDYDTVPCPLPAGHTGDHVQKLGD